eukprot:m.226913 g.226913  ORF g.226913 m.226913 type:complete len:382 (+) comp25935_c1_seq12:3810-4955(+)
MGAYVRVNDCAHRDCCCWATMPAMCCANISTGLSDLAGAPLSPPTCISATIPVRNRVNLVTAFLGRPGLPGAICCSSSTIRFSSSATRCCSASSIDTRSSSSAILNCCSATVRSSSTCFCWSSAIGSYSSTLTSATASRVIQSHTRSVTARTARHSCSTVFRTTVSSCCRCFLLVKTRTRSSVVTAFDRSAGSPPPSADGDRSRLRPPPPPPRPWSSSPGPRSSPSSASVSPFFRRTCHPHTPHRYTLSSASYTAAVQPGGSRHCGGSSGTPGSDCSPSVSDSEPDGVYSSPSSLIWLGGSTANCCFRRRGFFGGTPMSDSRALTTFSSTSMSSSVSSRLSSLPRRSSRPSVVTGYVAGAVTLNGPRPLGALGMRTRTPAV